MHINAYSEWCPKFAGVDCEHVGTLMAWLGVDRVDMVGFQTRGRIDGLILMLPPKGKGFFLYTHLCVYVCIHLFTSYISLSPCLFVFAFWSIFADPFRNTPYILYLSTFLHLFFPSSHIHIYISTKSFYVSTYMYLFPYESTYLCFLSSSMFINICLSIYLFIDLPIYPMRSKKINQT